MKFLSQIFSKYTKKYSPFDDQMLTDFTPEQKQQMIESAISSAAQVLLTAAVITGSTNHIHGEIVLPDNKRWKLTFEKIDPTNDTTPQNNK